MEISLHTIRRVSRILQVTGRIIEIIIAVAIVIVITIEVIIIVTI